MDPGFNVETIKCKNKTLNFTIWDLCGQDKILPFWHHYYQKQDALIFVVDSADKERFCIAADDLQA